MIAHKSLRQFVNYADVSEEINHFLEREHHFLEEARTIKDTMSIRKTAVSKLHDIPSNRQTLQQSNQLEIFILTCERKLGTMIRNYLLNDKQDKQKGSALLLLGVSRIKSSRFQLAASQPDDVFFEWAHERCLRHERITQRAWLVFCRLRAEPGITKAQAAIALELDEFVDAIRAHAETGMRHSGIVMTPSWRRPELCRVFGQFSSDDLKVLPIGEIAKDDSLLYLWTIPAYQFKAPGLMMHWGFEPIARFVFDHPDDIHYGPFLRERHSDLIVGRRGAPEFHRIDLDSLREMDIINGKPNEAKLRAIVESTSCCPFIHILGDCHRPDWTVISSDFGESTREKHSWQQFRADAAYIP